MNYQPDESNREEKMDQVNKARIVPGLGALPPAGPGTGFEVFVDRPKDLNEDDTFIGPIETWVPKESPVYDNGGIMPPHLVTPLNTPPVPIMPGMVSQAAYPTATEGLPMWVKVGALAALVYLVVKK